MSDYPCILGRFLADKLFAALREQSHPEIVRCTSELNNHKNKCPVCQGIISSPAVPLADQLFGAKVRVSG
jgi:hypothetical protein